MYLYIHVNSVGQSSLQLFKTIHLYKREQHLQVNMRILVNGNLVPATSGGNVQLGETTGYGFVVAGYSGCRVKAKIILTCQQALARLIVTDDKYKSLEEHRVFGFRD